MKVSGNLICTVGVLVADATVMVAGAAGCFKVLIFGLGAPLNRLLKKDKSFEWTQECQKSFDTLKQRFTAEPVLMMPDLDSNGNCHPVAYFLKTFNDMERNYEIYDRELLGVICALEEWRHYIQGSGHTTIIHTDHQNLTYFKSAQKVNRRQA